LFSVPERFELVCHSSPPCVYPEETHDTVQVCVPLERALYSVIRESETGRRLVHNLGSRDVLAIPIGQPHSVTWRRPADIVSLQLTEEFIAEATGNSRLRIEDTFTVRDPFISSAAAQLRDHVFAQGDVSIALTEALATLIAWRIGQQTGKSRGIRAKGNVRPLAGRDLARLEEFVDANLDQSIAIRELARLTGMSLWHFMRRLNAALGISPNEYITARRMHRAKVLLVDTRMTVSEVALEVGLSHSHFSRHFLKHCGTSPSEYRKETS
jgi:AraC family transcriptional regulator